MNRPRYSYLILAVLLALILAACSAQELDSDAAAPDKTPDILDLEVIELIVGDVSVKAEVADTHESRQQGLMYRQELAENAGMLFVYPQAWRLSFWMKNTYIPLDIAFIDRGGMIVDIQSMQPLTTRSHQAPFAIPYALEMNKGWFEANGIETGDRVSGLPSTRTAEH